MSHRSLSERSIEGLRERLIKEAAAWMSYERSWSYLDLVTIRSHTDNTIEASIIGKGYQISILYDTPVNDRRDLDCDCSCPDDRGGWCKHICAVLSKFIDNRPQRKRIKQATRRCFSPQQIAALKSIAEDMNRDDLVEIVTDLLDDSTVQNIISNKIISIYSDPSFTWRQNHSINRRDAGVSNSATSSNSESESEGKSDEDSDIEILN